MERLFDIDYNIQRKQALINIEKNQKPSNTVLGILGLTTYFSKETLNDTLFDKVLFAENEERRINHIRDRDCFFMPLQQEALDFVNSHNRTILLAPTSFGKTLIIKECIFKLKPNVIAYIVPTNALAYELEGSFKSNASFDDYVIFDKESTGARQNNNCKLFFIGTQEKFLEINDMLPPIDMLIIDEAYKLEETAQQIRGYKLSKAFLDTIDSKSTKIVLLCPTAKVIGFDSYGFDIFETRFNAVDRVFHEIPSSTFYDVLNSTAKNEKTILFCQSPSNINNCFSKIDIIASPDQFFLNNLQQDYHKEWSVTKYFEKGILIHHGQMPKYIQNKMLNMFLNNKNYKLLIGTNSISEGINTPTKNIFIHPEVEPNRFKMLIKNTIGRAGRLGVIPIGHIYSSTDLNYLDSEELNIILSVSKDEESDILEDINDETKLEIASTEFGIDVDFLKSLIKETKMSLRTICKVFSVLMKDCQYPDLSSLPYMASNVFVEYRMPHIDSILIKGVLQSFYRSKSGEQNTLNTFDSKIAFFKEKYRGTNALSNSDIIDNYMRFLYSSLDNYILVIANIGKKIMAKYSQWPFGINVKEIINSFLNRYYKIIYGVFDFDDYSIGSQKVMITLREQGLALTEFCINKALIEAIESKLNIRYSTFDVINAIREIANSNSSHAKACQYLLDKYF